MVIEYPTGAPAAVLALHTAGDLLTFHPHIHGLLLAGVLDPYGRFVPAAIDKDKLQERFARNVLQALLQKQLLSPEDVDNILGWPHSGFSVFIGDPIDPCDADRLLFVARYLKKCPVSNERIHILEQNGSTTIRYLSFKNGEKSFRDFEPLEFLAELSQHIPDTWEQTTRFLGAYSSRTRGARKAQAQRGEISPFTRTGLQAHPYLGAPHKKSIRNRPARLPSMRLSNEDQGIRHQPRGNSQTLPAPGTTHPELTPKTQVSRAARGLNLPLPTLGTRRRSPKNQA